MRKEWIVVGAIIAIITVGWFGWLAIIANKAEATNVEVTSINGNYGCQSLYFTVFVSIFNHGGSGTVTVWVEVKQDYSWKKAETVSIDSKEPMDLTFVFSGPDPYREIEYRAWVSY